MLTTDSTLTVSYSRMNAFDRCEFAYDLRYLKGWYPKSKGLSLSMGTLVHKGLELHYRGEDWTQIFQETDTYDVDMLAHAGKLITRYVRDFAPFEDRNFEILAVELHIDVPAETPKGRTYRIQGYIDLVVRDKRNGNVYLIDHKTIGQGKFLTPDELAMDPQMPIYSLLYEAETGTEVFATIHNMLNKYQYKNWNTTPVNKLFRRELTYRSDIELTNILLEVGQTVDAMIDLEQRDTRRRSLKKECKWCWYRDPCFLGLKGMDVEAVLNSNYEQRNNGEEVVEEENGYEFEFNL